MTRRHKRHTGFGFRSTGRGPGSHCLCRFLDVAGVRVWLATTGNGGDTVHYRAPAGYVRRLAQGARSRTLTRRPLSRLPVGSTGQFAGPSDVRDRSPGGTSVSGNHLCELADPFARQPLDWFHRRFRSQEGVSRGRAPDHNPSEHRESGRGSWGDDGSIVYGMHDAATGLFRISASGGEPEVLTTPNVDSGERDHGGPSQLPDGRGVLFTNVGSTLNTSQVAVLDFKTGQLKMLIQGGSFPQFIPLSEGSGHAGYLVYAASSTTGGPLRS